MKLTGLSAIITILILSCAKPNYQPRVDTTDPQNIEKPDPSPQPDPDPQQPVDPVKPNPCRHVFVKLDLCLNYKWTKSATATEMGSLEFYISEKNKPEIPLNIDFVPAVILWMPSMGHGSRPVIIEKLNDSKFSANKIFFIMPGEWEIRFQLKNGIEIVDEYKVEITI